MTPVRQTRLARLLRQRRRKRARIGEFFQDVFLRCPRRFWTQVRAPRLRRLRQGDQQRLFRIGEANGFLVEINPAGGANALNIAAIRRERQVQLEDLTLRQSPFDLYGAHHLGDFGRQGALPRLQQSRRLHRDGGGAGDDAA